MKLLENLYAALLFIMAQLFSTSSESSESASGGSTTDQSHFKVRSQLYHYAAHVTRVYDADTLTVDIDLGLNLWRRDETIRLWKIDAPELRGDERQQGLEARDFVRDLVLDRDVLLRTILNKRGVDREGKYGRLLGEIVFEDAQGGSINLNALLVERGYAVEFGEDGSALPSKAAALPSTVAVSLLPCPFCGQLRGVQHDQERMLPCSNCLDAIRSLTNPSRTTSTRPA